jgi:hypothetical protein
MEYPKFFFKSAAFIPIFLFLLGSSANGKGGDVLTRCSRSQSRDPSCHCPDADPPKVVVYNANDPTDVARFNKWLHGTINAVQLDGGRSDWNDWLRSLDWMADLFSSTHIDIRWSVPLIPNGASLDAAALGSYNDKFKALAQQFTRHYGRATQINIRLGWEFNGTGWNPWSAVGKPAQYKKAYRQFVEVFRSVGSNFRFEWTPNIGDVGMNPEDAYPGDDVVDIVGMDFYYNVAWDSRDPVEAWNYFVREMYGLQWHQDFAAAHHKPTAYAEWGVNSDGAGPFIVRAAQWFNSHRVVYQNYWDSNSEFTGRLSNDQYPTAGAAYRAAFATASKASQAGDGPGCSSLSHRGPGSRE